MSARERVEEAAWSSPELLNFIVEQATDAIVVADDGGTIRFANKAAAALFERPLDALIGMPFGWPLDDEEPQEVEIVLKGRERRIAEMRVTRATHLGNEISIAMLRDVTERVRLRERLKRLSLIDDLTGLSNRRAFVALAEQALRQARRESIPVGLMFVDVDGLKEINDTFGHGAGDTAIIDVAGIMRATFRESDVIARIGGDEFCVLVVGEGARRLPVLRERLGLNVRHHNTKEDRPYELSVSIGAIGHDAASSRSLEELLVMADEAMYKDKRSHRRRRRVLVIDEHPDAVTQMNGLARTFDLEVVPSGDDAIARVRSDPPDAIVVSVRAGEPAGVELIKRFRGEAETAGAPIIAVTSGRVAADQVQFLDAGADDWLEKPVDGEVFRARLERHLRRSES